MDTIVNIHEAKTHLSRLLEEVADGKQIIIAKAGKPVARIAPLEPPVKPKKFGALKGRFAVPEPEEFNRPLPDDVLATFGIEAAK
ncbi:MAG: type II toxin-antitoxin system Phd/YefM family antitoxin [Burkholderiales bacterium]